MNFTSLETSPQFFVVGVLHDILQVGHEVLVKGSEMVLSGVCDGCYRCYDLLEH